MLLAHPIPMTALWIHAFIPSRYNSFVFGKMISKAAVTVLVTLALTRTVLGQSFADTFTNPPNQYRPKFRYW